MYWAFSIDPLSLILLYVILYYILVTFLQVCYNNIIWFFVDNMTEPFTTYTTTGSDYEYAETVSILINVDFCTIEWVKKTGVEKRK